MGWTEETALNIWSVCHTQLNLSCNFICNRGMQIKIVLRSHLIPSQIVYHQEMIERDSFLKKMYQWAKKHEESYHHWSPRSANQKRKPALQTPWVTSTNKMPSTGRELKEPNASLCMAATWEISRISQILKHRVTKWPRYVHLKYIIKADGNIHIQKLCYKLGVVGEMTQWLRVWLLFQIT